MIFNEYKVKINFSSKSLLKNYKNYAYLFLCLQAANLNYISAAELSVSDLHSALSDEISPHVINDFTRVHPEGGQDECKWPSSVEHSFSPLTAETMVDESLAATAAPMAAELGERSMQVAQAAISEKKQLEVENFLGSSAVKDAVKDCAVPTVPTNSSNEVNSSNLDSSNVSQIKDFDVKQEHSDGVLDKDTDLTEDRLRSGNTLQTAAQQNDQANSYFKSNDDVFDPNYVMKLAYNICVTTYHYLPIDFLRIPFQFTADCLTYAWNLIPQFWQKNHYSS